jgi:hypothetical protein
MYTALLARFHRPDETRPSRNGQAPAPGKVMAPYGVERLRGGVQHEEEGGEQP